MPLMVSIEETGIQPQQAEEIVWRKETEDRPYRKDLTGKMFGKWHVDSFARYSEHGSYWNCTCTGCGKQKEIRVQLLTSGKSKSCGGPGCKTHRTIVKGSEEAIEPKHRRAKRVWDNLMEMADPKYRRCDKKGNLYKIWLQPQLKSWDVFLDWTLDNGLKSLTNDIGTAYSLYSPLSSIYHIRTHMLGDLIPFIKSNMYWNVRDETTERGIVPDMVIDSGFERYYLDPFTETPMTRKQISETYGIPIGTISAKLKGGMGLEELISRYRRV